MKKIKKKKYLKPTSECVEVASICTIVISPDFVTQKTRIL